jgi:hypothetical protein
VLEEAGFELTQRTSPFPQEFVEYFDGTVGWLYEHLSEDARARLAYLIARDRATLYFAELDLTAVLRVP